jgi:hypothetical protein
MSALPNLSFQRPNVPQYPLLDFTGRVCNVSTLNAPALTGISTINGIATIPQISVGGGGVPSAFTAVTTTPQILFSTVSSFSHTAGVAQFTVPVRFNISTFTEPGGVVNFGVQSQGNVGAGGASYCASVSCPPGVGSSTIKGCLTLTGTCQAPAGSFPLCVLAVASPFGEGSLTANVGATNSASQPPNSATAYNVFQNII